MCPIFTSFVCPWKDLIGFSLPSLQTWMHLSVEQDAKESSVCQSTSKAGAEWNANCCFAEPLLESQMMVVRSTPKIQMASFIWHLNWYGIVLEVWYFYLLECVIRKYTGLKHFSLVFTCTQYVISNFVPFQRENGPFVLTQILL